MAQRTKVDSKGWSDAMAEWWENFYRHSYKDQDEVIQGLEDALRVARIERETPQQTDKGT